MVLNQAKLHKPFRSKNVFREVQTCKNLPKESQAIVQKYISKNAYFAQQRTYIDLYDFWWERRNSERRCSNFDQYWTKQKKKISCSKLWQKLNLPYHGAQFVPRLCGWWLQQPLMFMATKDETVLWKQLLTVGKICPVFDQKKTWLKFFIFFINIFYGVFVLFF